MNLGGHVSTGQPFRMPADLQNVMRDMAQNYLASGMTPAEILEDFDSLTLEDIQACLSYAADRERHQLIVNA